MTKDDFWIDESIQIEHEKLRRELWKDAFISYFNYRQDSQAATQHADRVVYTFDQRFNPTKEDSNNDN